MSVPPTASRAAPGAAGRAASLRAGRPPRLPTWAGFLAIGALAVAAHAAVVGGAPLWQRLASVVLGTAASTAAALALSRRARALPAGDRRPWNLLAAAQWTCATAALVLRIRRDLLGLDSLDPVTTALFVLHYPLFVAGLVCLLRRRVAGRVWSTLVDAAILAIALGLLLWVLVAEPLLRPGLDPAVRAGLLYAPLLDTVVLALALAVAMDGGRWTGTLSLLLGGTAYDLTMNTLYSVAQVERQAVLDGLLLHLDWLPAYALFGAAALHPSATGLTRPVVRGRSGAFAVSGRARLRVTTLALACLVPPTTMFVEDLVGIPVAVGAGAGTSAVLALLVLVRLNGLLAAARTAAVTDELTGLANRGLFLHRLEEGMQEARRHGAHVAVLFLDVDRFTMVNDALGHAAGDQFLVTVADRLRGCLGEGDEAARQSGDDFTVLLGRVRSADEAATAAERVRVSLNRSTVVQGHRVECSVSIGVAVDLDRTDGPADLLRHADAALHQAKAGGRNRVVLFDETSRATLDQRIGEEAALRDALDGGQFVAWFQPVVDMASGRIVGAEALARWIHPELGVLPPGRFLPLAEELGLVSGLSLQIAAQTVQLRHDLAGRVPDGFRLSLNLGVGELTLVELVEQIAEQAARCGCPPSGIALEILETAVIDDVDRACSALAVAREAGFAVALDDFGTGYSSLSLLRDLPLDTIKIDRSFVQRMSASPADAAIVDSVLGLARHLGLGVVAEGVETRSDVEHLTRLGAVRAQGFHYSPAVPAHELLTWIDGGPPWPLGRPDHASTPDDAPTSRLHPRRSGS